MTTTHAKLCRADGRCQYAIDHGAEGMAACQVGKCCMPTPTQMYLTPEQVLELNEKHGWFYYGDAQSDVSKAFAQDAIAMYERMRAAAPDLLAALRETLLLVGWSDMDDREIDEEEREGNGAAPVIKRARAAIAKATFK